MHFNIKEILTVTMILFAVIDIIGSIPVVIEVRRKVGHIHSEKATFVSFVLLEIQSLILLVLMLVHLL